MYRDIGNGIAGNGIEYYLPLFFDEMATLFDYLPEDAVVVMHGRWRRATETDRALRLSRFGQR